MSAATSEPTGHPYSVTVRTGSNAHTVYPVLAANEDAARAVVEAKLRPGHVIERVRDDDPFPDFEPTLVNVEVTPNPGEGPTVWPVWSLPNGGTDRGAGYRVKDAAMAARLERAMRAGAVHFDAKAGVNIYGAQYVHAGARVLGRYMNADLRRLGY